jgi:cytochrome c-type biogenesis protein CcmH/NrfG
VGDEPKSIAPAAPGATSEPSSQDQAKLLYNDGIDAVRRADNFQDSVADLSDPAKKTHAADQARTLYSSALGKFQHAVQLDPKMHEAWNYVGYTHRRLGDYDDALEAYEQALRLRPGYPEAIEYRAEAFLAVNRIADAQQAYLDLFATQRAIAGKLLEAMKSWIQAQRGLAAADPAAVTKLDQWVQERSQIAAQTASLTREGTASSWR